MRARKTASIDPSALEDAPLAWRLNAVAKKYAGAVSRKLEKLPIDRNFLILDLIGRYPRISQQALANTLDLDKASIVRAIDHLSAHGLVVREESPDDKREHCISATSRAAGSITAIHSAFASTNQTAFEGFSAEEMEQFNNMLERMGLNLASLPAERYELKYIKSRKTT